MPRNYGWRHDLEDRAWLRGAQVPFDAVRFRAVRPPPQIDPRPSLTIKDQKELGACSGFSRATLSEVLNSIKTKGDGTAILSPMFAYLTNQEECGCFGSDDGATIAGSVQAAMKAGICREETFPYTGVYTTNIPSSAFDEGGQHLVKSHAVLNGYNDCFHYLATGTGVIQIGIPVTEGFENCTGALNQAAMNGNDLGGHALAIVGYTPRKDSQGRNYLILVNSWGTGWGENGTAEVEPALFDQWSRDGYSELIGISDLQAYEDSTDDRTDWVNLYV
jgi:C1A family cysteine protease